MSTTTDVDWRVLGGVIPGPIPVEWLQTGDQIHEDDIHTTITNITHNRESVHITTRTDKGGVISFHRWTRQDWIHVTAAGNEEGIEP